MDILIAGLVIFIGVHMVPSIGPLYAGLRGTLGSNGYKGAFSLLAVLGLSLVIWGMVQAPMVMVFTPPLWAKSVALLLMPVPLILLAAAHMKGRIRAVVRHPMMLGTLIWAVLHLAANGDLASLWLFGGFVIFAVFSIITGKSSRFAINPKHDLMAVVGGFLVYAGLLFLHPVLFGPNLL